MSIAAGVDLRRAGFWRRWFSTLLDVIIVGVPFQIIVVILFALTGGAVQMTGGGIVFQSCRAVAVSSDFIPPDLSPAPPQNPNFARECTVSFLGLPTGHVLYVGHAERQGNMTNAVWRGYALDAAGKPVQAVALDGWVSLALLIYLIALSAMRGQTIGDRVARIRMIDVTAPPAKGVRVGKVVLRYVAMMLGAIPAFVLLILMMFKGDPAAALEMPTMFWTSYLIGAAWVLVLVVQIAMKRDPVYDWIAGTAVVRTHDQTVAAVQAAPA